MKEYGQFCPVAKATELLGERWTILVIRELLAGAAHFNELRRGLPLVSPSLLSTRLKTLERHALVARSETSDGVCYHLTESGEALRPIVIQLGLWGLQWTPSRFEDSDLDPRLLMWDMRRQIDTGALDARTVLHFEFRDQPSALRFWWLIIEPGDVDVCLKDPGHEIDLYLRPIWPPWHASGWEHWTFGQPCEAGRFKSTANPGCAKPCRSGSAETLLPIQKG